MASNRSSRPPVFTSHPSVDLAGRSVALSIEVPARFDAPLAAHHRVIGRWVASRGEVSGALTRHEAQQHIETAFAGAVANVLGTFDLADLRVVVLFGEGERPPALAIVCDTVGQLDLGWIEKANVLRNTIAGPVAPVGWRAAAYAALAQSLAAALPVFGYHDLIEELSAYYWDGETDDEGARRALTEWHGHDESDLEEMTLPSQLHARRPDWMTAKPSPLKDMPPSLRRAVTRLRKARAALSTKAEGNAWYLDRDELLAYLPEYEEHSPLPPLAIVPFDEFGRELDDVGRFGMELGFDDIAGLCPLPDAGAVTTWFETLRLGAELMLAAQSLINLDLADMRAWK